jgi:1-acyl-sn-glycerol-3-phosphate acyltransferase
VRPEPERRTEHCRAILQNGPCTRHAQSGRSLCGAHAGPLRRRSARDVLRAWPHNAGVLIRRKLTGGAIAIEDGYDENLVDTVLPSVLPLYKWWWRVEVRCVENIPTVGRALLAGNHSGTIPVAAAMLKVAVLLEHGRNPWLLGADLVFQIPGLSPLMRATGNARAARAETIRLLERGELVGVFPEGFKGIGKGWSRRYQLQRFGRGGFVQVALETATPIVPVAIVGAEESYPMIGNLKFFARVLGFPYFPVTPTFPHLGAIGFVPLPSKWIIEFGPPIATAPYGRGSAKDPQVVNSLAEQIRDSVQRMLTSNLARRRWILL